MIAASNTESYHHLVIKDLASKLPDVKPPSGFFDNPGGNLGTSLYACSPETDTVPTATIGKDFAPGSGYFGYYGGGFDATTGSARSVPPPQLNWSNSEDRSTSRCTYMQKQWEGRECAPRTSPAVQLSEPGGTSYRRRKSERCRRYKTPSPQLLRIRREAANARERRRMHNLNIAFEQLRTVLPEMENGRRLSKFETLQVAQQYIDCLSELLSSDPSRPYT